MDKILILTNRVKSINSIGLVHPLFKNKENLRAIGLDVKGEVHSSTLARDTDIIFVDSKYFKDDWQFKEHEILKELELLKKRNNKVIWFDTGDSTGNIIKKVFSVTDLYVKSQILKNLDDYKNKYYGGRKFTDFFHNELGVVDKSPIYSASLQDQELKKLRLGWNYGLGSGYGAKDSRIISKIRKIIFGYEFRKKNFYRSYSCQRNQLASMRISVEYSRDTVAKQRVLAVAEAQNLLIPHARLKRSSYVDEMRSSQAVISPFGWGEIAIRDFECFAAGSLLIKPNMNHLSTFPSFYEENDTYLPISWEIGDLQYIFEYMKNEPIRAQEIARNAQEKFYHFAETDIGAEKFANHVKAILN